MEQTTHVRIKGSDNRRLKVAANYIGLKNEELVSQIDMITLLLDKFFDCHGDEINTMQKPTKQAA